MRKHLLCSIALFVFLLIPTLISQGVSPDLRTNREVSVRLFRRIEIPNTAANSKPTSRGGRVTPSGLPTGRSYYQGRYYGNPGNRYYGPQYGYF